MSPNNDALASALHRLADLLIERDIDDDLAVESLQTIERLEERFETRPERTLDERSLHFATQMASYLGTEPIVDGERFGSFDESPYSGNRNALSPRNVEYRRVGDTIEATILLGTALEGRPGRAHGGAVAAVFDDVMGALQHIIQRNGYTRTLHTRFLAAFPTDRPVTITASCVDVSGDRFTIEAEARVDDRIVASAEGVFTQIDIARWQRG